MTADEEVGKSIKTTESSNMCFRNSRKDFQFYHVLLDRVRLLWRDLTLLKEGSLTPWPDQRESPKMKMRKNASMGIMDRKEKRLDRTALDRSLQKRSWELVA